MKKTDKYVGPDVHQDTTVIAAAAVGRAAEVRVYGTIPSDIRALARVLGKLGGEATRLHVVYEAGPTGLVVFRRFKQTGIDCVVVAPSTTPQAKVLASRAYKGEAPAPQETCPRKGMTPIVF